VSPVNPASGSLFAPGGKRFHNPLSRRDGVLAVDALGWLTSIAAAKARFRRSSSIRARHCRKMVMLGSLGSEWRHTVPRWSCERI
jgi:hypothetical protein